MSEAEVIESCSACGQSLGVSFKHNAEVTGITTAFQFAIPTSVNGPQFEQLRREYGDIKIFSICWPCTLSIFGVPKK